MSVVDEIKTRLDIVDIVSSYIPLKKAGRTFKANCPFHTEKTPSFVVFPEGQNWRCFGACNEGGDVFSFVMKMEGWDFREALQVLAHRAGVELRQQTQEDKLRQSAEERLRQMLDGAARLYMDTLLTVPEAEAVREYVAYQRGLNEDTVRRFQIGYAPDSWDFAVNHFRGRGYQIDEIIAAGLAIRNEQGRIYDRFRHRMMVPIRDGRGHTLGFGARALEDGQEPKYLNSPQGELFDKSRLLYGFDLARRSIRETETVVVTEGYMDVIQAHQNGFENVVAQMGTALTETQIRQLAKYANRVILALDTDVAGTQATMRGLEMVRESLAEGGNQVRAVFDARGMMRFAGTLSLDVRVLRLPAGKDPDEFIRATPDQWETVVENAQSLVDYVIETGTRDLPPNATIQERERIARTLLPLLTVTESNLLTHRNIQLLARRLRIPERDLVHLASSNKPARRVPRAQPRNGKAANRQQPAAAPPKPLGIRQNGSAVQRYCLSSLLAQPDWVFVANRRLRELANQANIVAPLLSSLERQDFIGEDYRVLFELIETASYAGEEPLGYIQQQAPHEIVVLAEAIVGEGRLEAVRQLVSQPELDSIIREYNRYDDEAERTQYAFLISVLKLRLERLKRERNERYFVTQLHDENQDDEMMPDDHVHIRMYVHAQRLLEQALQDLARRR